jgi:hypothetical protein
MHYACAILHRYLRPVQLYHIFLRYLIKGKIFEVTEHKKCVLIFSTTFLSGTFSILKRNERDIGIAVNCPLFLSDFNETCIFSTDFRKILKYQIS